ncbi:CoA transferase [Nocardioides sp. KR10-350]|uniref:CaiB/BaiF CoA transferase family protein n=1 Tax=Nocardioides cheoyonin TaxID=3156615 RepID=UPI0032B3344A
MDEMTARSHDPARLQAWPARSTHGTGPLAGLRVLDLTAYAVGPWAACNLAQLGADVIHVDPPYGDPIRAVLPRKHGEPTTYLSCTLGKRSIVLNLKDPGDHEIAVELAKNADVLLENSRAGTLDRLGLGYADLKDDNPGLVYCSSSSFGDTGPLAAMGSTDPQGQAFSGFASLNGSNGGEPEVLRYVALVDLATSMQLLNAVLLGLVARRRTGRGTHLRTSQLEAALSLQITRFAEYFSTGVAAQPTGSGTYAVVPSRAYKCADNAWVSITAPTDASWEALCRTLGSPETAALLVYSSNQARLEHREEIDKAVESTIATRPAAWWTQLLPRQGVACTRLRTLDEKPEHHDHIRSNGFIQRVPHPLGGDLAVAGPVWRFERTPVALGDPELPGNHTRELLNQMGIER